MKYNLETGSHTVYALQYHFVTVTKCCVDLPTDKIAERIGEIASDISEDFGVNIQNVNGGSDHVHILFTEKPTTNLTKFINSLKGVTSRKIRDEYHVGSQRHREKSVPAQMMLTAFRESKPSASDD